MLTAELRAAGRSFARDTARAMSQETITNLRRNKSFPGWDRVGI